MLRRTPPLAPLLLVAALLATLLSACDEDPTYRACGSDGECGQNERCVELRATVEGATVEGRMCSRACEAIEDCDSRGGGRSACFSLEAGESAYCYGTCATDEDCLDGARCLRFGLPTGQQIDACFPSS